jgi:alcohol dehydrogenase class IV
MFPFEFATAGRIVFGTGKLNSLAEQLPVSVRRLLLVRANSSDAVPRVREILSGRGIQFTEFEVSGEPTVEVVRAGAKAVRGCDGVIGLGGGSVIDTGKAIAILATNRGR